MVDIWLGSDMKTTWCGKYWGHFVKFRNKIYLEYQEMTWETNYSLGDLHLCVTCIQTPSSVGTFFFPASCHLFSLSNSDAWQFFIAGTLKTCVSIPKVPSTISVCHQGLWQNIAFSTNQIKWEKKTPSCHHDSKMKRNLHFWLFCNTVLSAILSVWEFVWLPLWYWKGMGTVGGLWWGTGTWDIYTQFTKLKDTGTYLYSMFLTFRQLKRTVFIDLFAIS